MGQFDDYDLVKEPSSPPSGREETRSALWTVVIAAVVVLTAAAGYYYWTGRRAAETPATSAAQPRANPEPGRGPGEPGEDIEVPPLDQSDDVVRQLVRRLSQHPAILEWLATDGLIRNFTVVTTNIANGTHPERHLRRLAPKQPFLTRGDESNLTIDPRSYSRYDRFAEAVGEIDARGAARLYATLKPRIEEAYRELGEPARTFDDVMERAIVQLLRVPTVKDPVALTPKPMTYAYADPKLEALTPPQKHLLRMGADNVKVIQDKLREIAEHLGIPAASLPSGS